MTVNPHPALGDPSQRALIDAIQRGLPMVQRPYAAIAAQIGLSETEVIARVGELIDQGVISRFGVVVRHHELGYRANAMVVWDVPDEQVGAIGRLLGAFPFVTLCYRRPRRPPSWPYNLFTMVHGQDRGKVLGHIDSLASRPELTGVAHQVLFSRRRFKQRGANYAMSHTSDTCPVTDGQQ